MIGMFLSRRSESFFGRHPFPFGYTGRTNCIQQKKLRALCSAPAQMIPLKVLVFMVLNLFVFKDSTNGCQHIGEELKEEWAKEGSSARNPVIYEGRAIRLQDNAHSNEWPVRKPNQWSVLLQSSCCGIA